MSNELVFITNYNKVGYLELVHKYSIGSNSYDVYTITFSNEDKVLHDERTNGKLHFITEKDVKKDKEKSIQELNKLNYLEEKFSEVNPAARTSSSSSNVHNTRKSEIPKEPKKEDKKPSFKLGFVVVSEKGYIKDICNKEATFSKNIEEAYVFETKDKALFTQEILKIQTYVLPVKVNGRIVEIDVPSGIEDILTNITNPIVGLFNTILDEINRND